MTPAFAIAAMLLGAAPAQAEPLDARWSVQASAGAAYVTDRSLDFIGGTDAMTVGDVRAGWAPWAWGRVVELNLGYTGTSERGTTFGSFETDLTVRTLQLGATYRRALVGPLTGFVRVAGLLDFARMELWSGEDALRLSQSTRGLGGIGTAGVEAAVVRWPHAQLGLVAEVGYALRTAAKFDALSPDVGDPKPAPVAFTPVNAGTLSLSGIQWRLGAAVHF